MQNFITQLFNPMAGKRGSSKNPEAVNAQWPRDIKISLVGHSQRPTVLAGGKQLTIVTRELLRAVNHNQDEISLAECFIRLADADALSFIKRLPDSRSINQLDWDAAHGNGFGHQIPRSAGGRSHDGSFALHQAVEQTRFPHVRPA